MTDEIPDSEAVRKRILNGDIVISEKCPSCGARWSCPTGDTLTCMDCYNEFPWNG